MGIMNETKAIEMETRMLRKKIEQIQKINAKNNDFEDMQRVNEGKLEEEIRKIKEEIKQQKTRFRELEKIGRQDEKAKS